MFIILIAALSVMNGAYAQEKNSGYSHWTNPVGAIWAEDHNEQGDNIAHASISAFIPNFQTNPLDLWGFPAVSTDKNATVCVRVSQSDNVPDMYGVIFLVDDEGHGVAALWPSDDQWVHHDWTVLKYKLTKDIADWSCITVSLIFTSGLTESSDVRVDGVWVE